MTYEMVHDPKSFYYYSIRIDYKYDVNHVKKSGVSLGCEGVGEWDGGKDRVPWSILWST